ncbi:Stage II sporulation protein E (SpoIIE) [Succinivibrio dextrinosolvens]|uniref:SpoIIE family protein phosphatase n=1 Tax=Succinivibrio dextrinosolvens TaxID=83771 RepID=UPI0008E01E70|nr:SpoIIE family protein phosphatase [Succinivibrio dextrinosolvens]SFS58499.1 Stage II sporulation protein E (SpoIIE) [Succinivibrio dextrinosolvens]
MSKPAKNAERRFRFKTKVMFLSLCLLIVPLLLFSYYSYDALKSNIIQEQKEALSSESRVLKEFVHENFQWVLSESVVPLFSIRKTNEEQLFIIKKGITQAISFNDENLMEIAEDYILGAGNTDKEYTFISNTTKPYKGMFISDKARNLLESRLGTVTDRTLADIIRTRDLEPGKYYHYYFIHGTRHFLGSLTRLNKDHVICLLHDISTIKQNYDENYLEKAFALDLVGTISAINRIDPVSTNIYVFTEERKSIIRKLAYKLPDALNESFLEKAKQDEVWEGYLDKMNYAFIFYFKQTGWFFMYTINLANSVSALNDSMEIIWVITVLLAGTCIFLCSLILRKPLSSLTSIAKTAEYIEHADLTNKEEIEKIAQMLPEKSNDEIGMLSETMKEMSRSVSDKAIELLSANAQKRQLEGELNAAKEIQMGILPESLEFKEFSPLKLSAMQVPAKEVGGDLYDAIYYDEDHVALVIGDVSDKGVPAALFMAMTVILIRECVSLKMPVEKIALELNKNLCQHNPNMMFVTLFVGILNKRTGEFSYVNCGHCVPYVFSSGKVDTIEGLSGPAIGVAPGFEYKSFSTTLPLNSNLFFFTDGVSEAQNPQQELYGEKRIEYFLENLKETDPAQVCSKMMGELVLYRNKAAQSDDITILCVRN